MDTRSQRPKKRDGALSSLNVAIEAMDLAKEISVIAPAKAAFGTVSALLTMIRDSITNEQDYVEIGLGCADICRTLERGMNGKKLDDLSQSVREAINQLTTTVTEIQRKVVKQSGRNAVSRLLHAKNDKETIAGWNLDLNRILLVFNTELVMNTHVTVSDICHEVSKIREGIDGQGRPAQTSMFGELPPPPPRACFGRNELIENIVCLAENLTPIALIGAGGIGKTSIALTILHDNRIEQQFGDNRRFIRCDQFPATLVHFLCRLSKVIGAGVDNPGDLAPLRPFLSSKKMFIILDNAESVLDPQGTNAQEIYAVVEELSQFKTISLCITSRITTVPRHCKRPGIPALSMGAARDIFYNIYDDGGRSGVINDLLQQLDFHALSITLLATTASHNVWDHDRLAQEWDARRTQVLRTDYNESLAATIELSLSSLTFQELGPDARDLLGIIAFFPQGIDENNLDWLFPTVSNTKNIFDKFCVLSLTYRTNGFITMLAPLRDYLVPEDREPSPLLYTTKSCYFRRLSIRVDPDKPSFEAAQWITSEDVNVEYLLDVFTRADANSDDVWDACCNFMEHLYWHKSRLVVLGPKIEGLPDDYPHKPKCLLQLSLLLGSVGNLVEEKRLLIHTLKLWSEQGDDFHIARTLRFLAETNGRLGLFTEGIEQAKEALTIYERLGNVSERAAALHRLSWLFYDDKKLEAAEEVASRLIDLLPEKGKQFQVCQYHCVLGNICRSKGETQKAIDHFVAALGIASSFNWHDQLFWNHYSLAELFSDEDKFDDAHVHIGRAKSHAINDPYLLGRAMELEAQFLRKQCRLEAAKLEALRAADVYERLGATKYLGRSRAFLQWIEEETSIPVNSDGPDFDAGETLLQITNPTSG